VQTVVTQATGTGGGAGGGTFANNNGLVEAIYRVSTVFLFVFDSERSPLFSVSWVGDSRTAILVERTRRKLYFFLF
jgi:hypothetical protein